MRQRAAAAAARLPNEQASKQASKQASLPHVLVVDGHVESVVEGECKVGGRAADRRRGDGQQQQHACAGGAVGRGSRVGCGSAARASGPRQRAAGTGAAQGRDCWFRAASKCGAAARRAAGVAPSRGSKLSPAPRGMAMAAYCSAGQQQEVAADTDGLPAGGSGRQSGPKQEPCGREDKGAEGRRRCRSGRRGGIPSLGGNLRSVPCRRCLGLTPAFRGARGRWERGARPPPPARPAHARPGPPACAIGHTGGPRARRQRRRTLPLAPPQLLTSSLHGRFALACWPATSAPGAAPLLEAAGSARLRGISSTAERRAQVAAAARCRKPRVPHAAAATTAVPRVATPTGPCGRPARSARLQCTEGPGGGGCRLGTRGRLHTG